MVTIRRETEASRNLWGHPRWPLFSRVAARFEAAGSPIISALTLTWFGGWASSNTTLATAAAETQAKLARAIGSLSATAWLFLAQTPWQPRSAIVKHKRIWKRLGGELDLSRFRTREEVCIESVKGIRFAAVGGVSVDGLSDAMSVCRSFEFGCLLLGPPGEEFPLTTGQLFSAAFPDAPGRPASTHVDWPSLTSAVCSTGSIAIRETSRESEVSVDFFVNENQFERFTRMTSSQEAGPNGG